MGIYYNPFKKETEEKEKEQEYKKYIADHKLKVLQCFDKYNDLLMENLSFDIDELRMNVLKHDTSKLSEKEFPHYRQFFFPTKDEKKDKNFMNIGWLNHIHSNPHHWNYWIIAEETNTILDMPHVYIAEMILDWAAMSLKFNNSIKDWYRDNYNKIIVSDETRLSIDRIIDQF